MPMELAIPGLVVLAACCTASVTDVREFKIRNVLTIPLLATGLLYHGVRGGGPALLASASGAAVGFAILFIPYLIGVMGAGDVKLMAAVGAWVGIAAVGAIAVVACLAAGVYSTVVLVRQDRLRDSWTVMLMAWRRLRMIGQYVAIDDEQSCVHSAVRHSERRRRLIPFSLMITVGVLALLALTFWAGPMPAGKVPDETNSLQKTVE